jgi:hypothetical protein
MATLPWLLATSMTTSPPGLSLKLIRPDRPKRAFAADKSVMLELPARIGGEWLMGRRVM